MPDSTEHPPVSFELSKLMHHVKETWGHEIETRFAKAHLARLVDPTLPLPDKSDFDKQALSQTRPFVSGWRQDNSDMAPDTLLDAGSTLHQRTLQSLSADWDATSSAYSASLPLPESMKLDLMASNPEELGFVTEAAKILGYKIKTDAGGTDSLHLPHRAFLPAPISLAVANRINIGLVHLIEDYEAEMQTKGGIRRPVLRTIVALADRMADTYRNGLPPNRAYAPQVAEKLV